MREQLRVTFDSSSAWARVWAARAPILYSLVAVLIVVLLAVIGWVSTSAILTMLVPLPKVLLGALERPQRLSLPRLGIIEIVHSVILALVMIWVWA